MHTGRTVEQLSVQADDFPHHQFGHTSRVGKRRVKYGDTSVSGTIQIDLVGANTKASHGTEGGQL